MKSVDFTEESCKFEKYSIKITVDNTYTVNSADNPKKYDHTLTPSFVQRGDMYTVLDISVAGPNSYSLALIGSYHTYQDSCAILEGSILTVLQNDHIIRIDLDTAQIIKEYEIDMCGISFGIYSVKGGYIIYGEVEILKLDLDYRTLWSFSGKDIFVSATGKRAFELTKESIKLYDFEDNFYELDYDGNVLKRRVRFFK
ncbi:MAG: hypothetical protein E7675_05140 [Ruminococcaceae bacterium]|nr:hypothetical protein [Oscillospiraceae bacterium]